MWALFRLVLSRKYWRALFHPETWRASGVSIKRVHKDKRARKQLLGVVTLLLAPLFCLLYIAWIFGSAGGIIGFLVFLVVGFFTSLYRLRKPVEQDGPQTLNLSERPKPEPDLGSQITPELISEFAELALLHAVLASRAGSEQFVQTKELPEGMTVTTRRKHIEVLREFGIDQRLATVERDLILMPDGHWSAEAINKAQLMFEPLRLLRWVLGVDNYLPTVGATLQANYKLSESSIEDPSILFERKTVVEVASIRKGLEAAEQYFYRCWAEGVKREFYILDDEEQKKGLVSYADEFGGKEHDDLLLGSSIVSIATDSEVRLATTLSLRRTQILRWIKGRMYGEEEKLSEIKAFNLEMTEVTES